MPQKNIFLAGIIIIIIMIASSFIGTGFFYFKYISTQSELNKILTNPQEAVKQDNKNLIARLRTTMDLPADEEPTIAVINDLAPIKGQAFFAKAKVGDRVIIFQKAKKAVLYDPVANKIVEVGPVVSVTPTPIPGGETQGNYYLNQPTITPAPSPISTLTPTPTKTQ